MRLLKDYGATTARRAALLPLAPPQLSEAVDRSPAVDDQPVADLALLQLLAWACACGVLGRGDAGLLWELVVAATDEATAAVPASLARGVSSTQAGIRVAAARGVTTRTVQRQRDRAVGRLRLAAGDFEIGDRWRVYPPGVPVLTGIGAPCWEGRNA